MEYYTRYGLEFSPFLKNSKPIFVDTSEAKEVRYRLNTFLKTLGFGVLTGGPGRGKTTLVKKWADSLNPSLYCTFYSSLSTLTVQEFYRSLAQTMHLEPAFRKSDNFRLIHDEVVRLSLEKKCCPVIIIDEANSANSAILNDLKLLFNFDMDSRDRAAVLLVGLPKLNQTLKLNSHEPLRQRLTMNYNLEGMSREEGREYIAAKLKGAGGSPDVFEPPAAEAILGAAEGAARMVNKLCNASLIIGDSCKEPVINLDIAIKAIDDCTLD